MNLPKRDVRHFYRLYNSLLFYINKKFKILKYLRSPRDLLKSNPREVKKLKDKLFDSPDLIDSFINDNPMNFSARDLEIIASWKNFIKGRFLIVRHLKTYSVFLGESEPPKAYGVLGLITPIEELLGSNVPIMVETTLLPFKNRIIYDGTLLPYNIIYGSGIRKRVNDFYSQAKTNYGIITSLPFSSEKTRPSDSELLKSYLRNEYSRDIHNEEIQELISKNPDLMTLYHEEMGKIDARAYRKKLNSIGIVEGWFALIYGINIASGRTREEVEQILKSILPAEKMKLVYIFQLISHQ